MNSPKRKGEKRRATCNQPMIANGCTICTCTEYRKLNHLVHMYHTYELNWGVTTKQQATQKERMSKLPNRENERGLCSRHTHTTPFFCLMYLSRYYWSGGTEGRRILPGCQHVINLTTLCGGGRECAVGHICKQARGAGFT